MNFLLKQLFSIFCFPFSIIYLIVKCLVNYVTISCKLKNIPQITDKWFLSIRLIFLAFVYNSYSNSDIYFYGSKYTNKFPKISYDWIGFYCLIDVRDPEYLKIIFNSESCNDRADFYVFPYKTGILQSNGEIWRKHRKLLNPAFNARKVIQYMPIINEKSKVLVEVLENQLNEKFNVFRLLSAFALDSIMKTSLDLDKNFLNNLYNQFFVDVKREATFIGDENVFPMTKMFFNKNFQSFVEGIVKEASDNIEDSYDEKGLNNWIKILVNNKGILSDEEITDEVVTLILSGNATTAITLSTTLLMLGMNQDIQDKVVDELKSVFHSKETEVNNANIQKLTYLECVIKETMRLFPLAPIIGRKVTDDVKLDENVTLPSGANLVIRILDVHRNPAFWGDDANKFKPERFFPENIKNIHPYAFIPFTAGSRICIGYKYAMNAMKIVLSHILRNYHISTDLKFDELKMKISFVLQIAQHYMITIKRRDFDE